MKIFTSLILCCICVLLFTRSYAQNKSGSLNGTVHTADGKPAGYVSISLIGTNKGTMTNESGYYIIHNIKPGNYRLRISLVGFKNTESPVNITAGTTQRMDFSLPESAAQLNEVTVAGGNTINKPVSLGKADIRPLDLPQSTGVISSTVIRDQQAVRLGDVVKNVSGVSLTQTRGGVAETFSARGYSIGVAGAGGSIFKNGVISNTMGFPDASTLESIEVLKGSSALLYGNVSGGVIINLVTKKPKFDWGGEASMLVGSYNQYKPTLDLYGPITKNLAFRVIGTHEDAKSYRDVVQTHRTYVNPSLLYKIGDKTDILLEADYLKSGIVPDAGVGAPNARITITDLPKVPRSRFINTDWAYNNTRQASGFLTINHRFNQDWRLTAIGSAQSTSVRGFGAGVPTAITATGDYTRSLSAARTREKDYTGQLNLNGHFNTGTVQHQLLVGADFVRISNRTQTSKFTSAAGVTGTAYDKINIYNPNLFIPRTDIPDITDTATTTAPQNRYGLYVQDLVSLTRKFKVLAGVRYSFQQTFQTTIFNLNRQVETRGTTPFKSDGAFSPKIALIYQPIQTSSVYASYTNNFTINTGTDINGNNLRPSIINQYELGLKNEFMNGRLAANLSIYRIQNSNFAQTSIINPAFRELTGETTSDGLEVDLNGTLSKNFYFIAGYGYNHMRYTNTAGITGSQVEGERLINNPKHTANGSIFYTLDRSNLRGLKFGLSAFYTGKRYGGNNNVVGARPGELNSTATTRNGVTTYTSSYDALIPLKGFATIDFSAGYTYHQISLLAKVANIFNTYNYIVHDRYSLNPIPPRMYVATLAYRFGKL